MEKEFPHPDNHPLHTIKKERAIIVVLAVLQFLHILDFVIMMPLGPVFMESFKIDSTEFGLLVSAYSISAGIFGFIGAFFLDRFDRRSSLLTIFAGFALGTLFCAVAPTYITLLLARIVAGCFGGMISALILSIIGDIIPVFRRGKATGVVMSAFSIASVIGIPVGLFLANQYGWHFPFLAITVISFLLLPASYKILPELKVHLEHHNPTDSKWSSVKTVLTERSHYSSFAFMIALMFGGFSIIPFFAPYLVSNVGLDKNELTYIYFFGGLFTFFTSRYIGILADRYGKYKMYAILTILAVVPVTLVTSLGRTPLPWVIVLSTLFMIIVSGRMVPAFALVTSAVEPKIRGSFMSVNSSIQSISAGAASFISGHILTQGVNGELVNFELVGMISIVCLLVSVVLASKIKIPGNHI
ncbi:MFS transporter [Leptospira idonii]|uniref:MFS transporter n=1 Tax=Leptospira idonii TaxID=1193500 RepID=A0A4R9LXM2_9LEPT|nr:MFS transporter [Leptospira idonii]TGN17131.1 MFS transporter [Leptospira idonii]